MSNITPKQRRNVIEGDLENYVKSENDFLSLRKSFIDLNFSLALAYEHDKQKVKKYLDAAKEIQGLEDKQDKRGKWEINEDNNKKVMIPHKDDEKFQTKFEKENPVLFRQLQNELELMNNEARLYEKIKDNKDKGIDKLTPLYAELQEGQIDVKRRYGDEAGKPIDADRFRRSYPNATKMLEQTIEKWAEKETKKENTEQKGREI